MWACTCHSPPTVDLTEFLVAGTNSTDIVQDNKMLRETLSRYGWCIVSADLTKLGKDSPLQSIQPLDMKQQMQGLFEPGYIKSQSNNTGAIYRGRRQESGSAQEEPKQSWEVKRCTSQEKSVMHAWTRALHTVAVAVTRVSRASTQCAPAGTRLRATSVPISTCYESFTTMLLITRMRVWGRRRTRTGGAGRLFGKMTWGACKRTVMFMMRGSMYRLLPWKNPKCTL